MWGRRKAIVDIVRCKLHWYEGNTWKGWVQKSQLPVEFYYKYAVLEADSGLLKRWEGGANRCIFLRPIEDVLDLPQNAYTVHFAGVFKFSVGALKLTYIRKKEHLIINDVWQN